VEFLQAIALLSHAEAQRRKGRGKEGDRTSDKVRLGDRFFRESAMFAIAHNKHNI
jgi:hypothetical protein